MIDFTLAELLTGLDLEEPVVQLGGFPWRCFDTCVSQNECVFHGCRKLEASTAPEAEKPE